MQYSICSLNSCIASMLVPLSGRISELLMCVGEWAREICFKATALGFLVSFSVVQLFYWHDKFQDYCQMYKVDRIRLHAALFGSLTHTPFYPPELIAVYCIAPVF